MSAFIVSPKTIDRIVNYIVSSIDQQYIKERLETLTGISAKNKGWETKLANEMMRLNYDAVNYRYKENQQAPIGKWVPSAPDTLMQTYKSLNCLVYQCSEGEIPKRDMFKFLEFLEGAITHRIVTNLTDYDLANWD